MNQKFIKSMMGLPFDRTVAIINELATEYGETYGADFGEWYRAFLVHRLIRCVQGVL